jgi:hypothetical protein
MDTRLSPARRDDLLSSAPLAVRDFCQEHGLTSALEVTGDLVRSAFGSNIVSLRREKDPETREEWVSVEIAARGSQEDVLAARKGLIQAWVKGVPQEFRRYLRLSVRVS